MELYLHVSCTHSWQDVYLTTPSQLHTLYIVEWEGEYY
jgi:hypothetical protein